MGGCFSSNSEASASLEKPTPAAAASKEANQQPQKPVENNHKIASVAPPVAPPPPSSAARGADAVRVAAPAVPATPPPAPAAPAAAGSSSSPTATPPSPPAQPSPPAAAAPARAAVPISSSSAAAATAAAAAAAAAAAPHTPATPKIRLMTQASTSRSTIKLSIDGRPSGPTSTASRPSHHDTLNPDSLGILLDESTPKGQKDRRHAAGSEAIRDQIRKLAVGGPQNQADDKHAIYEVSDSEDEDLDMESRLSVNSEVSKPQAITDALCAALKGSFVFAGISESRLLEVVDRMYGVCFRAGSTVLQQGALPKPDDCMYFLQEGEADLVVSGAVDQGAGPGSDGYEIVGNNKIMRQRPGWLFGDVALLFNSSRTASVVARSGITLWALERKTFLAFVMKHAQGARALRFLRNLPLLKGLSDNNLIEAASRMPQRTYQDGEALIKYGERGEELYLIRYGKVRVMRPDGKGGQIEAVVLGRGQFVGERSVINNKLRSADCVAQGVVQVVAMKKRDFMDLDNPLMAWMMDYDAVSTCLRFVPYVKGLKQEQMEQILDRFDARQEMSEGQAIIAQGELMDKLYVIKLGEVKLLQDGRPVHDPEFVQEASGFSFFGKAALQQPYNSPYTVVVASESLHVLMVPKKQLDQFLGIGTGLVTVEAVVAALKKGKTLKNVSEAELLKLVQQGSEQQFSSGDVIAGPGRPASSSLVYLVKSGEVVLMAPEGPNSNGQTDVSRGVERGRLLPGSLYNEEAAWKTQEAQEALKLSLVAAVPATTVLTFTLAQLAAVTGRRLTTSTTLPRVRKLLNVRFQDLECHRIIGTGQFGLVRLVRHVTTNEVYALKVMHKAPIVEVKQMEHVVNERRILEEAVHPFCVQLKGAYQDKLSLYLLQEWVPGGELFHHLDLEGAFDEATTMFFAANVLLALEFLHKNDIVYRDLKPENLLIDAQGYLKMADFGFAKHVGDDKTFTICGTPDYQAPEVIMRQGTTKAADYWALGVLIFEMLVGDPPFKSITGDPWDTFRRTLSGRFYVPNFISQTAADIIFQLLQVKAERRLGCGPGGADDIKRHKFFAALDWDKLERKELPAPIVPKVRNPLDTSNFDNFDNCEMEPPLIPPSRLDKQPNWDLWEWIE